MRLFERRDYQLDVNASDAEDQDDFDRGCERRAFSMSSLMDDPADMYTPRGQTQHLSSPLAPPSIVAMLQEQQGMMKRLLTEQEMRKLVEQKL